jgi:iron(III) transport system ATP-binding protein
VADRAGPVAEELTVVLAPEKQSSGPAEQANGSQVALAGVSKSFGAVTALSDLTLQVARGEFLALLGPSGCGKTTALRLIAGLEKPDSGTITIGGRVVAGGDWVQPGQRGVGMVFQDYALFPHMTVSGNVAFGVRAAHRRELEATVTAALELVGLAGLAARYPHELSGGEQQRVALARALAPRPEIILLDEPFSNLDAALRRTLRSEVREILHAAQASAVFVTHDQEEALSLGDVVAVMEAGSLVQVAAPYELYTRPVTRPLAEFLGEANFVPGVAAGAEVDCLLGRLRLDRPCSGPVQVLLRPEMLTLTPTATGPHTVEEVSYFGHDQLVRVRVGDDLLLTVRDWGQARLTVGERVELRVTRPVAAYSANGAQARCQ